MDENFENENVVEEQPIINTQMDTPQWQPETRIYNTEMLDGKKAKKAKKAKKEKKPATMGKVFALCAVMMVVTLVANGAVTYYAYNNFFANKYATKTELKTSTIKTTQDNLAETIGTMAPTIVDDGSIDIANVVDAVMPSVVAITSTSIVDSYYNPFYNGGSYQVSGAGSGIIIGTNDTELLIVTNNHVVEDTTSLTVQFCNDVAVEGAYIKGTDADNDLAVVAVLLESIDEDTISNISIATLGDSDALNIGETVIAIGNALGYGQSVTRGIVSALDRVITLDSGDMTVIQTDAAINGGNSGGALLNLAGEVIGINVAKTATSSSGTTVEGMGYAIPVSQVKDIIDELMNMETRYPVAESEKGYLGINYNNVIEVDNETSEMYRIPVGVYIRELDRNSVLAEAGVSEGSVITKINNVDIESWNDMTEELSYYRAGEKINITISYMGNGKYEEKVYEVTLKSYDEIN